MEYFTRKRRSGNYLPKSEVENINKTEKKVMISKVLESTI
tara:strand:- start:71301 stop:71420 length:120 start_codon:yes stop_codon:yes gene_type:complete